MLVYQRVSIFHWETWLHGFHDLNNVLSQKICRTLFFIEQVFHDIGRVWLCLTCIVRAEVGRQPLPGPWGMPSTSRRPCTRGASMCQAQVFQPRYCHGLPMEHELGPFHTFRIPEEKIWRKIGELHCHPHRMGLDPAVAGRGWSKSRLDTEFGRGVFKTAC